MKTSVPHYRRCNIVFSAVFTCVLHLFFLSYHGSAVGEERASSNECGVLCLHSIARDSNFYSNRTIWDYRP